MEGQISLFDINENESNTAFDKNESAIQKDFIKCYKSSLETVEFKSIDDLFRGFDTLKAITFSYSLDFIDRIINHFQNAEIILGADFLIRKDPKINEVLAEVLTNAKEAANIVRKYERLMEMMKDDRLVFRTPEFILDHRKIYILKADDGRTRVIRTSANMTHAAWNNDHMEFYEYDDSELCCEEYERDFETAWVNSDDLPFSMVTSKKCDDLIEGNAVLKGVKEVGKVVVLKQRDDDPSVELVKYTIDHEKTREDYTAVLTGLNTKLKNGLFELTPKILEKILLNNRKLQQKRATVTQATEKYPTLEFDYTNGTAMLNEEELNLNPSKEEIKNDIDIIMSMFSNYTDFVTSGPDGTLELQKNHFKLLNALFVSPFHAKIRCVAKLKDKSRDSLPMVFLASSSTANCGKTFAITAALKLMTGMDLEGFNKEDTNTDMIRNAQAAGKGVPIFIDEMDNRAFTNLKAIIKHPEQCENIQREEQPLLVFASNDILEPDDKIRKRIGFLRFDGSLKSSIDQSAYKGRGTALIRRMGSGLYREYLKRMIVSVREIIDYMIYEKDIPDDWYPDLMALSCETLLSIITEQGYELPEYMMHLTWNEDYSANAGFVGKKALDDIISLYKRSRKSFIIQGETVTIELGGDNTSKRLCQNWENTLPPELRAKAISTRESNQLVVNQKELEARIGIRLGPFWRRLFE